MRPAPFRKALRAFSQRAPFQPYAIELMSGQSMVVTHPEAVMLRGSIVVFRQADRINRLFDNTSVCQLHDLPPDRDTSLEIT